MERRLAGHRRGMLVGLKRENWQRLTMHWMEHGNGRMAWCNCLPSFRVGDKQFHPRRFQGMKAHKLRRGRLRRPYWHRDRTAVA